MFGMSRKKTFAILFMFLLLIAAGGVVVFSRVPEEPDRAEPAYVSQDFESTYVPRDFVQAIEGMRDAVLEYNTMHGYLPDIVDPGWTDEDDGLYRDAKKFFVEATRGGKLAVAVVSNSEKTTRLVGVFSGDLMSDGAFRRNLARAAKTAEISAARFYGVDGEPYGADAPAVYVRLE